MAQKFLTDIRLPNSGQLYLWNDHDSNYLKYDRWRASASAGMNIQNVAADGEIYLRSGNALSLTLDGSQNATFAGRVMADTHFQSSDANATLSATGTGNIYLRPNGYSTTAGQAHINTSGNATFAGSVTGGAGAFTGTLTVGTTTGSNINMLRTSANYINATNAAGYLVFRTGGFDTALTLDASQNATFAGTLTVNGADAIRIPDYILHTDDDSKFGFPSNDNFKIRLGGVDRFNMSTTTATFAGNVIATDGTDTTTLSHTGLALSRSNSYIQSNADNSDTLNIGQSSVRWGHVKVDAADFAVFNGGNERFKITSAGNVGIGVTNPGSTLPNLFNSTTPKVLQISSATGSTDSGILIRRSDDATGIDIWNDSSNGVSYIDNRYGSSTGDIYFRVQTNGTPKTVMTITGDEKIGIGTTNPGSLLHLSSSTGPRITLTDTDASIGVDSVIADISFVGTEIGGETSRIASVSETAGGEAGLRFYTGASVTQALKLDKDQNATFTGDVILGTGDSLYLNGTTGLRLLHDGSNALFINQTTGDFKIQNSATDKDIIFRGKDGASTITALTLDMSDAGKATFNNGWSSDGQATEYTWRIPNTTSNDGHWYKIARVTSIQSTRFKLQMVGGHSYSDGYYSSEVNAYGQLNNDSNYDLIFHKLEADGQNGDPIISFGQVDVDASSTDLYVRLNTFAELVITASISNGDLYPDDTSTGSSTTPTNFVAALEQFGILSPTVFQSTVRLDSQLIDGTNDAGTSGQILSSTGSVTNWIDVPDTGDGVYLPLAGGTMTGDITINDNVKALFGNSSDLEIYHDINNSNIENNVGALFITNRQDDGDIIFKSDDGSGGVATYFYLDGGGGITRVSKNFRTDDGAKFQAGSAGDLEVFHDGSNSYIENYTGDFIFTQALDDGDMIFKSDNGSGGTTEYLRLDGGDARMYASREIRFVDGVASKYGNSGDLGIYHDGSDSYIESSTGNLFIMARDTDADISFQSDNGSGGDAEYFRLDGGITSLVASKDLLMAVDGNGGKIKLGASQDLEIFHSGSHSYIKDVGTGSLYLQTNGSAIYLQDTDGNAMAQFTDGGGSFLFYNGNLKLSTTNTGIGVTGNVKVNDALIDNASVLDIDSTTTTVASVAKATYTAAFFDYVIKKGTNVRAGVIYACHDGTNVEFAETSTVDLGDTSDATLSITMDSTNMMLRATTTSNDWSVKSLIRAI